MTLTEMLDRFEEATGRRPSEVEMKDSIVCEAILLGFVDATCGFYDTDPEDHSTLLHFVIDREKGLR